MRTGKDDQDAKLDKSGQYGCDGRAFRTESRKTEVSVDQDPVADEVYEDRSHRREHRNLCFSEVS